MNVRHSIRDDNPWFHPECVKYLSAIIKPEWEILETGSGSSTIYFALKAKRVISFENSIRWHARIKEVIEEKGIKNIDLRLRPDYEKTGIHGFKENEFDLISIDGCRESRVSSVLTATPFLKHGGYILFDNSENIIFKEAIDFLNEWPSSIFGFNDKWQTTVWRKP